MVGKRPALRYRDFLCAELCVLASLRFNKTVADLKERIAEWLLPLHVGAEGAEVFDESGVGAFNRVGVFHDAAAGDARGDHVQGDGGADHVGRVDHGGAERAVAEDIDAVRVADEDVGAEFRELGHPGKAVFVDLVPEVDRAGGAGAERDHQREEIDGEIRPGCGFDLGEEIGREGLLDDERLVAADDGGIAFVLDDDAEFGEGADDEVEVMRKRIFHANLAAGDGAEREEGDDFVVVGRDAGFAPVEFFHAFDAEHAGANAVDLGAHRG